MYKLGEIYNEIKILKPSTPIRLGKHYVNPSTSKPGDNPNIVRTYNWEEGKNFLSKQTLNNCENFFIKILGITPQLVKIESSPKTEDPKDFNDTSKGKYTSRKSFYIYGEYNGEPIMLARRESPAHSAGQTKIYSKYKVVQLLKLLYGHSYIKKNKNIVPSKQIILNDLGINTLR